MVPSVNSSIWIFKKCSLWPQRWQEWMKTLFYKTPEHFLTSALPADRRKLEQDGIYLPVLQDLHRVTLRVSSRNPERSPTGPLSKLSAAWRSQQPLPLHTDRPALTAQTLKKGTHSLQTAPVFSARWWICPQLKVNRAGDFLLHSRSPWQPPPPSSIPKIFS